MPFRLSVSFLVIVITMQPTLSSQTEVDVFVAQTLELVDGRTPYDRGDLRLALRHLAFWCHATAGLELDSSIVLRRETIDRFVRVGLTGYSSGSQANLRSQLLRVAEFLIDRRHAPVRLRPLASGDATAPYSRKELVALRGWAATQSTDARRANAAVLLSLGLGAGLVANEIGNVTANDLMCDGVGAVVRVTGARARNVPVLNEWTGPLIARVEELSGGTFVFRPGHEAFYPNLVSNFVARGQRDGVKPQTQRLRSTWIVRHLNAGTPVKLLMRAAGVESLEAFTRYVKFTEDTPAAGARTLLSMQTNPTCASQLDIAW